MTSRYHRGGTPLCRFIKRIRKLLEGVRNISERRSTFLKKARLAGLDHRYNSDLNIAAISRWKADTLPNVQWRPLANTVIGFDGKNLPEIVAVGSPEIYQLSTADVGNAIAQVIKGTYNVEEMIFGTVCWLYYHSGRWRCGTKRSVDNSVLPTPNRPVKLIEGNRMATAWPTLAFCER